MDLTGSPADRLSSSRALLVLAAAAGLLTGLVALSGHVLAVVAHGVGGLLALVLVGVVARRLWTRRALALVVAMVVANLTGVAWTVYGETTAIVVAHVLTGILAAAGALILATEQ